MQDLPPGYQVRRDSAVGAIYVNAEGHTVMQHLKDDDTARAWLWVLYRRRIGTPSHVLINVEELLQGMSDANAEPVP